MTEVPFDVRVSALEAAIRPADGPTPAEPTSLPELESLKGWLDDVRLNLWGKLQAAHQSSPPGFEERFRVQRTIDLCLRLAADLRAGRAKPQIGEYSLLSVAMADLTAAIQAARNQSPTA